MGNFRNIDDLINKIEKDVKKSLQTDVADKVTEVMQKHIQEDVYNEYDPKMYDRREEDGGLIDEENIDRKMIGRDLDILKIRNVRRNSPYEQYMGDEYSVDRDIAEVVETGFGYNWSGTDSKGRTNAIARPFTRNTREDLRDNGQHTDALKNSLKNKGYDIK